MRAPMEKGFGSRGRPASSSIWKVSRGAVAGGEDEARGLYALGDAAGADEDAAQGAVFDIEALKPGTEADLAAEALDLAPEADDDAGEHVGAEVGLAS